MTSGTPLTSPIAPRGAAHELTVVIREIPPTATAAHSELVAQAQSGGGDVDIYGLDVTWVAEFAEARWLRALEESTIDRNAFLDKPLWAGEYDGELYALPFNTDAGLLFYRRDLVGDTPPATWPDLVRRVTQVWTALGEEAPEAGYAAQLADYEGLTVNALEAVLAEDPTALDLAEDEPFAVTDATVHAMNRLAEGLVGQRVDGSRRSVILPESLRQDERGSRVAFEEGRVMFMRNWPIHYRLMTDTVEDEEPPVPAEAVGVARLPGVMGGPGRSVLGGQSLAVARSSDQPRAAQALIEFLTSGESQRRLFHDGGFAPTRTEVYELREFAAHAYLATLREAVEDASLRPIHQRYEPFSEAWRRVLHPYLTGAAADPPVRRPLPELRAELDEEVANAFEGRRG